MPRANLGQLLGNVEDPVTPAVVAQPPQETAPPDLRVSAAIAEKSAPAAPPSDELMAGATYLRFVRKDTRLREDQLESLTSHARRLNRKRRSAGPRLTENTLIRVAVDLLLDRIDKAVGDDEAALLESVRR